MNIITDLRLTSPLVTNPLIFDNSNFILQKVEGLESPLLRLPRYNLPGASGAFISNQLWGERTIKITGNINAPDHSVITFLSNRLQFTNTVAIAFDDSGMPQPLLLQITLQNGQVYTTGVYLSHELSMVFDINRVDDSDFLLQFVAPDMSLYSATPITLQLTPGTTGVINNTGILAAYPVINMQPSLTDPILTNTRTAEYLSMVYTLSGGDQPLLINNKLRTITQGGVDKIGIQTAASSFFSILPGNNTLSLAASAGAGMVSISIFPAITGI